jgi:hypothetical protein
MEKRSGYLKLRMVGPPCSRIASFSLRGCPFSSSTIGDESTLDMIRTVIILPPATSSRMSTYKFGLGQCSECGIRNEIFPDLGSRVLDRKPMFSESFVTTLRVKNTEIQSIKNQLAHIFLEPYKKN